MPILVSYKYFFFTIWNKDECLSLKHGCPHRKRPLLYGINAISDYVQFNVLMVGYVRSIKTKISNISDFQFSHIKKRKITASFSTTISTEVLCNYLKKLLPSPWTTITSNNQLILITSAHYKYVEGCLTHIYIYSTQKQQIKILCTSIK